MSERQEDVGDNRGDLDVGELAQHLTGSARSAAILAVVLVVATALAVVY